MEVTAKEKKAIIHVHNWGKPWTDFFQILPLSSVEEKALHEAASSASSARLKEKDFSSIWSGVDTFIKKEGPVFVRLSSTSPKDTGESLCCRTVDRVFEVMSGSFRVAEDLDSKELGSFSVALRKWDSRINEKNEYRSFIFNGVCEAIAKRSDGSAPSKPTSELILKYVKENVTSFPEATLAVDLAVDEKEIIFIEFNPVDNELDTLNITSTLKLTTAALEALKMEPFVPFPSLKKAEEEEDVEDTED